MVTVIRCATDTIRPHNDYGRRLHTDLPQRLVRMRRGRRFPRKTPIGKSVCHTPSPYNEHEPSRHSAFSHAPREQESDFLRSFRRLHVRLQSHTCSIRARHPPTTDATMFSYKLCLKAIDRYDIYAVLSSICRSRSCEYHHERGLILFGNV